MVDPQESQADAQISIDRARRIGSGDRRAEQELVERYGRALLYLLKRRTHDPELALDVRQDTFRIAIEKLRAGEIQEPGRVAAYLRGIALNLVIGEVERPLFKAVMDYTQGNQSQAAGILGINRGTLRKKLRTYSLIQ